MSKIDQLLLKLEKAISKNRSITTCHRLWSKFIRERDGHKCLECGSNEKLSAHHICRKSFLEEARFMTGNGITLCKDCHKEVHKGFNGKPDLQLPMDAQGGEKIETLTYLYGILANDAKERGLLNDRFYYLSDQVLCKFKLLQSYDPFEHFPGLRIEQAFFIWNASPMVVRNALLEANGFEARSEPFLPGISVIFD